jgi:hypothetical protein
MSKNEQMTRAVIDDAGRTAGPASLCQGVYGARGNLELIVPDAADGLWVHWFNSDLPSDPAASADVPPGTWSGGLRFATGRAYAAAVILQSPLGPDHLEVLSVTRNRELESWYWSPGPGFQRRGTVVSGTDAIAATIAQDGALDAAARVTGAWRRLVAGPEGYPERRWVDTGPTEAPPASRNAECVSTRNGGTLERVVREPDGVLVHLATRGARDIS